MQAETTVELLIVGAGFGGLIMAIEARKRGFKDILILEKADDVGGTWRENTYPGVACDVPSHLYSMASNPNPDWTTAYAGGAEIRKYIQKVAKDEGLYELCQFGRTFQSAAWDGTRWQVETEEGQRIEATFLVSALGPLHIPLIPNIPGADSFDGPAFHSAKWDHNVDLTGKRIAVVGTGASAIQFVPFIARKRGEVAVFQRTPPYVLPRPDGPISKRWRKIYRLFPITRRLRRLAIYCMMELRHRVFVGKKGAVDYAMQMWRKSLERSIKDPQMQQDLTPDYRIGCKRILSSNSWYPTLARKGVRLISGGVARIKGNTVTADNGETFEADVLIWGTGFNVTEPQAEMDMTGINGTKLSEVWKNGASAHLGITVNGFPNLFFLLGPHTGLGHNSVVLMIEAQVKHICDLLHKTRKAGAKGVFPKQSVQAAFTQEMSDRLSSAVWQSGGCVSWYQDANGRNPVLWPGTVTEYRRRTRKARAQHYEFI